MTRSMTGFASRSGAIEGWSWQWELRSVNGRGLDLRLRMPDWIEGLEQAVRKALTARLSRGSVTLNLRVSRSTEGDATRIDAAGLANALGHLSEISAAAAAAGVPLAAVTAADVMGLPGVLQAGAGDDDTSALARALNAEIGPLLDAFDATRAAEGAALAGVIGTQLDRIAALTAQAADLAEARKDAVADTLRANLARILDNAEGADPQRVAQELALLAVKADVTEEIDRLAAHVEAARALLSDKGPIGRKFDFLTQEFNREANTLCSKAGAADLTAVGLDLKSVIDQMREQIQNVE